MTQSRHIPPNRRQCNVVSLKWPVGAWSAPTYHICTARGDDDKVFEMFISSSRPSTEVAELIRDVSIIISIALQYGTSIDDLRVKISRLSGGEPSSVIGAALDVITTRECNT